MRPAAALLAALALAACSSETPAPADSGAVDTGTAADTAVDTGAPDTPTTPPLCTPGTQINCGCPGGVAGVQVCGPSGAYGACGCPDAGAPIDAPDVVVTDAAGDVGAVDAGEDVAADIAADVPDVTDALDVVDVVDARPTDLGATDSGTDAPGVDLGADVAVDVATDAPVDVQCPAGRTRCGGDCIDTRTSARHCGACDVRCEPPNGAGLCTDGVCGVGACFSTFRDCDLSGANGCEADTRTNVSHCGMCGTACPAGQSCANGVCALNPCAAGLGNCDGLAVTGCETDLQTTPAHCGACGRGCPFRANAVATCAGGACGLLCDAQWGDCDRDPADGCEADLRSRTDHCGVCGHACAAGEICTAGACVAACAIDAVRCNAAGTAVERCVGGGWTTLRTCGLSAGDDFVGFCQDNACRTCRRGDGGLTSGCGASTCTTDEDCYRQRLGRCVAGQCARRGYLPCTGDTGCFPWAITGVGSYCTANGTDSNGGAVQACTGNNLMPCSVDAMCPSGYRCDLRTGRCATP